MIPTIETIVEGLRANTITTQQAVAWLHQHAADACRELRDDFAAAALTGLYANSNDAFLLACAAEAKKTGDTRQSSYYAREAYETADAMLKAREQ